MGRGILTESDREYLRGNKEYAKEANKRRDIRERVYQSLHDFELLASELDGDDRLKIFDRLSQESESHCSDEVASVIEFLYKGLGDLSLDPDTIAEMPNENSVEKFLAFRKALTSGIAQGKSEYPNSEEELPDTLTIASNASLFEFPDDDEVRSALGDQSDEGDSLDPWKEINRGAQINRGVPGRKANHDDIVVFLKMQMQYRIHQQISARHQLANKSLVDYTKFEE